MESLRTLFQDVALQSHTPLALVDTWVRHRARENPDDDLYAKILPQLRKIEITYDRLALSMDGGTVFQTTEPQPLDLGVELKRAIEQLPQTEQRVIRYDDVGQLPYIQADPVQISFMFSAILVYLSRLCGGEENGVKAGIIQTEENLLVRFSADAELPPDASEEARGLQRARFDLALGEPAIRAVAQKNHAAYRIESAGVGTVIELDFYVSRAEKVCQRF